MNHTVAPVAIKPRRKITGISAILLSFDDALEVDWDAFRNHVKRTVEVGLVPAVNMDTGYGNLIPFETKAAVLEETSRLASQSGFVAGAFVRDEPGQNVNLDGYKRSIDQIQTSGGVPVIFQSFGLTGQPDQEVVESYRKLSQSCDQMIAFELSNVFAPFGAVYSLDVYRELMEIPSCIGAKHSSLSRAKEWDRLLLRNEIRPEFKVFTGNDLAIDMVMYGSDYLLGLSTFAPDYFAKRDAYWEAGDPRFYELNDVLQYLGFFAFRDPVPAYKHDAAMFLKIRGWSSSDTTHPNSPKRPDTDREVLLKIFQQLENH